MKIWACKIGETDSKNVPWGGDQPMRQAIRKAYKELTGEEATFVFSGWGGELTDIERDSV